MLVLFGEYFKAYRGEGEKSGLEKRIILHGKGNTPFEAVSWMNLTSSFPLEYAENRVLIYTMDLVKSGLEDVLDVTARDQKASLRQYLLIFNGQPEDLMSLKLDDEQFIGLYLNNMMMAQEGYLSSTELQYFELMNNITMGSQINVIPVLTIVNMSTGEYQDQGGTDNDGESEKDPIENPDNVPQNNLNQTGSGEKNDPEKTQNKSDEKTNSSEGSENKDEKNSSESSGNKDEKSSSEGSDNKDQKSSQGGGSNNTVDESGNTSESGNKRNSDESLPPHLLLNGAVVLVGEKFGTILTKNQLEDYNFFKCNIKSGLFTTQNPEYEEKQVSVNILNSKVKEKIKYEKERVALSYSVKLKVALMEAEDGITLSDINIRTKLIDNLKKTVEARMLSLFNDMKAKKIDILDVKKALYIKYPALEIENPLSITDLKLDVEIILNNEGTLRDAHY